MNKKSLLTVCLTLTLSLTAHAAQPGPKLSRHPVGPEIAFVTAMAADLSARFPHVADAEKAGYVRYTAEDQTGAISYENGTWQSADPQHPSQLWYDVKGDLLGADFSVQKSASPSRPHLWGVNPARWYSFWAHVHYVATDPSTGKTEYGWVRATAFDSAGGDALHPTAQTLVKLGKISPQATVQTIFLLPESWDLIVWIKPNPRGAFAVVNPDVTPSASATKE